MKACNKYNIISLFAVISGVEAKGTEIGVKSLPGFRATLKNVSLGVCFKCRIVYQAVVDSNCDISCFLMPALTSVPFSQERWKTTDTPSEMRAFISCCFGVWPLAFCFPCDGAEQSCICSWFPAAVVMGIPTHPHANQA